MKGDNEMRTNLTLRTSSSPARSTFAEDHADRDLPTGIEVARTKSTVTYSCTVAELEEWKSDAEHYSDWGLKDAGWDWGYGPEDRAAATAFRRSAQRVAKLATDALASI